MRPTLLIAEGDTELCDIYQCFLTERGYDVRIVLDGLSCLEQLRRKMPAVVVLDLDLRWGGGDGVLAWLRDQGGSDQVAVILMATGTSPQWPGVVEPPVVRHLQKPFSLATLLDSVRSATAKGGAMSKTFREMESSHGMCDL